MTLGEKIHRLRVSNDMTMEELARMIGVQRSAVNKYEKGIVVDLKRSTIAALARAFNVSPSYLLDDESESNELEQEVITAFRAADPGIKAAVCKLLDIPIDEKENAPEGVQTA